MEDNLKNFSRFTQIADRFLDPASARVVLDVGSRDAEVALYLKEHYANSRVYAFECNPSAIERCKNTIAGRPGVFLVEKAVADVTGPLDFYAVEQGNMGASSLYSFSPEFPHPELTQRKITVQATTLKHWAMDERVDRIDLIWIDLQGAELQAFRGLGDMIESIKAIYTEVENQRIYNGQPLESDVRKYLTTNGFVMFKRFYQFDDLFGDQLYLHRRLLPWCVRIARSELVLQTAALLRLPQLSRTLRLAWTIWMLRIAKILPTLRRLRARATLRK